jgi:hypothetical protein
MRGVIDEGLLDTEVEEAIRPFAKVVPPRVLERMRQMLRAALLTHPDVAPLTRAALQKKDIQESHETGPDADGVAGDVKKVGGSGEAG